MKLRQALAATLTVVLVVSIGHIVHAQDRMPRIPAEQMTAEQTQAVAEYQRIRNATTVPASFGTLLRSPEVMVRSSALGEYFRRSTLSVSLFEFVVLMTARHLDQEYVWAAHYQPAVDAGVSTGLLQELAEGNKPSTMTDDQGILWDLIDQLHRTNRVSDTTYKRAVERFGEKGVVDAVATSGYYTLLGMVMNTAQTPGRSGAPRLKVDRP